MTFGKKLQTLRRQRGMSQEELAAALEVSRQAVSKWELDDAQPDIAKIVKISRLFGVTTDELLLEERELYASVGQLEGEEEPERKRKKSFGWKLIAGAILAALGLLGNLTVWILSTMIRVHVTVSVDMPDGTVWSHGGGSITGYDYRAFIQEYRLQALLVLFAAMLAAGAALMLFSRREQIKRAAQGICRRISAAAGDDAESSGNP